MGKLILKSWAKKVGEVFAIFKPLFSFIANISEALFFFSRMVERVERTLYCGAKLHCTSAKSKHDENVDKNMKIIVPFYRKNKIFLHISSFASLFFSANAIASTTGNLPFVSTMNMLKEAISGPFLLSSAVIMIVVTCLMLAFGEWGDGFKRMINVVLWLSVAFAATSFITTMFGGGAVF